MFKILKIRRLKRKPKKRVRNFDMVEYKKKLEKVVDEAIEDCEMKREQGKI